MKLSNEMCEMALSNEGICTVYNDDYVILRKSMPVTDDRLKWYIEAIRDLKDSGVNIAPIVDYMLIDGTTRSYHDGKISYTSGIFLEERAKGVSHTRDCMNLSLKRDYDFNLVVQNYLKMVISYIEELELRAQVSQSTYDKLVCDCQSIVERGLSIDPKPLNFFFDKNIGYTIIDVVPLSDYCLDNYNKYFPSYMFSIVFGFGHPTLSINYRDISVLPQKLRSRLEEAGRILEAKIVSSLRKYGFNEDDIKDSICKNRFRYENKYSCVEIDDMENFVAQEFMNSKKEAESKGKEESDFFTITV